MKNSKFIQIILLVVIPFLIFKYAIHPHIPSSLLYFYMMIVVFAIFIYIISDTQLLQDFLKPVISILAIDKDKAIEDKKREIRLLIFAFLPILVGAITYLNVNVRVKPPDELRSIHPAPPLQISFRGKPLQIQGLENPLRSDAAKFDEYVEEGAVVYFENCFFCHGDNLDGKGHFVDALNPRPANFVNTGTIAQLQESYVFWRISKGGRGLPSEGAPWNSSMPAWEDVLTEEEIWKVIMYIYEASGSEPRRWEEGHE